MVDFRIVLEKQGWVIERESGTAYFYNFTPWVAPKAYLHVVFKGAAAAALTEVDDILHLPRDWREELSQQNGAFLFSGALDVYGVHAPGALLNRRDVFERLPISIVSENSSWAPKDSERLVVVGGYQFDGTLAVLDRNDGSVSAMPRRSKTVLIRWPDTDSWLTAEIERLSKLFDERGKITVSEEETLPGRQIL